MTGDGAALGPAQATTPSAGPLPQWASSQPARVVAALAVVVVGIYASKYLVRLLGRPVARRFERASVAQTVLRLVRLTAVVAAGLVAAGLLGFETSDFLLSVTVFSAVLGVVLAPIVGSLINGLFVLADQPYEIGDMIELQDGTRGYVRDITLRYTKVLTLDNTFLVIPNSTIREQQVTNFSAEDERTRLALPVLVTYESDVAAARDLIERSAARCEEVIEGGPDIRIGAARYPAKPTAYIDEFADSGVLITLRYWSRQPYKQLTVRSKVQTELRDSMAESDADVEIAYPHREVLFGDAPADAADARSATGERASVDANVRTTPNGEEGAPDEDATGSTDG